MATSHPLMHDNLDEFVNLTLDLHVRGKMVDISGDYLNHIWPDRAFQGKKRTFAGGKQLNWKAKVNRTGNAKASSLFGKNKTGVKDLTIEATEKWTKVESSMSYDVDEEAFQSSPETIIDIVMVRTKDMWDDFFDFQEAALWSAPSSTTQDPRVMSGIPHWVVKDATTTATSGFEGGNPTGASTAGAGGISTTTYPRWDNWAFGYTNVTRDDAIERMRKAVWSTDFHAPKPFAQLDPEGRWNLGIYTTYAVMSACEKLLEGRNENLGVDLAKYMGSTLFGGNPIQAVYYLNANDSTDPIYGINWNAMTYYCKSGRDQIVTKPQVNSEANTVRDIFLYHWGQLVATNRRRHWVGSTS